MNTTLYLVRLGEISLKGDNRDFFEQRLKQNIKAKIKPYSSHFFRQKGRLFIEVEKDAPEETIRRALSTSFGVVGFARAISCEKTMDAICQSALALTGQPEFLMHTATFKVETSRSDKSFDLNSYEISSYLGAEILASYPHLRVNVKDPDSILYVEIRDRAYLYTSYERGPGGLPVGTAGRGMLLLSGGIDSPVAGYRMAKRGLKIEAVYFDGYPYTSEKARQKVIDLVKILSPFTCGLVVHIVPFATVQLYIKGHAKEEEHTLLMRSCMMKIANELAQQRNCTCIVTGESLGQVASQTLESLSCTTRMSDLPVFRPLIGMDKEEIIAFSKHIGTYETSILPYEDCCTLFSPKHPLVRPDIQRLASSYAKLQIEEQLGQALASTEMLSL